MSAMQLCETHELFAGLGLAATDVIYIYIFSLSPTSMLNDTYVHAAGLCRLI